MITFAMRFKLCSVIAAACLAAGVGAAEAATPSALATLKKSNDEIRKLLKKQSEPGSPEEKALRADIKKIVNGFIDYAELSKRALAVHWQKITPQQREEFVSVLRDLIESHYVKQIRSNVAYEMKYEREEIKGDEATVHSTIKVTRRGRQQEIPVDYKLMLKDGRWLMFDMITDDEVSMVRNYKQQFSKIIDKDGFEGLLKKMKKKLSEQKDA